MFDDFGTRLPAAAEVVLVAGNAVTLWLPGLLLLAAAETALFHRLFRDPASRPGGCLCSRPRRPPRRCSASSPFSS